MRRPCEVQSNIRKPTASNIPPKLCGTQRAENPYGGMGLPDVPMIPRVVKHRGEVLRLDSRSKFSVAPVAKAPSEEEIRKVSDEAIAMFVKRWLGPK